MRKMDDSPHDDRRPVSPNTYRYWGCRCPGCREASTRARREWLARRTQLTPETP